MNYLTNGIGNGIPSSDAGLQLNNVEVLYSKVQRIYIKPQYKEERQKDLRVNVEIHAGLSPVCRKSLCVLLADDDDPCFLYSLIIVEDDFKILKAQQGLLVDFDNFATQLICLLEQCHSSTPSGLKVTPKFLLLLAEENNEWILKLVETNNFKHLCHLSLNICPSTDGDIKTHMAIKIKQLKENLNNKNRETSNLEMRLNNLSKELECKVREFEKLEQQFLSERNQLQMTTSHQLSIEKDRLIQAKLEWQRQSEIEKIETERRQNEVIKKLHGDLTELQTHNMNYKDKLTYLETKNKEQSKQIQQLEKELSVTQRDLSQLKKQNVKLDTEYHDQDKTVNDLKTKVAVLQQELKDKTVLISKHSEMLKTLKEQKHQLENLLSEKENQLQRKQNTLKNVSEEVVKANDIIKKLQNELSSTKSKLKLRTSIALEQERLLNVKQKENCTLQSKLDEQTKEIKSVRSELTDLKLQMKTLQTDLEDKEKTIKNNENVISWLNRRLAESQTPYPTATSTVNQLNLPSNFPLTLPRQNKLLANKVSQQQQQQHISPISGLPLRTTPLQNSNINNTGRITTSRSTGVGITGDGLSTFNKNRLISHTSTPLDRLTTLHRVTSNNNSNEAIPASSENNNVIPTNLANKNKNPLQGGLRRVASYKQLPSAYFPKSN